MAHTKKTRLLVVDSDTTVLNEMRFHLEGMGYELDTLQDGEAVLGTDGFDDFDFIVLETNLPLRSRSQGAQPTGFDLLRTVREQSKVPVMMLGTTPPPSLKAQALAIGADDFVAKPFDVMELAARINAILRRRVGQKLNAVELLRFQRLHIDAGSRRVWKDGELVELTGIEFEILYTLACRPDHVFSREKLIELAWKSRYCITKAVDVHIGHIRRKIEDDQKHPKLIVTVRGTGYRFEDIPA
jgi:DNA-binding response OmpR family regulator